MAQQIEAPALPRIWDGEKLDAAARSQQRQAGMLLYVL